MDSDTTGEDKIIDCPQCSVKNPIESDICYNCGASLHAVATQKTSRSWIPAVVCILFVAGVLYFYYDWNVNRHTPAKPKTVAAEKATPSRQPAPATNPF